MNRENIQSIYPLLPTQEAFLLAHQLSDTDPGCLQARFRLSGTLDLDQFQTALSHVLHRHELLRATIRTRPDKSPLMIAWKRVDFKVGFLDVSPYSADEQVDRLNETVRADRERGLQLDQLPPHRFLVCKTGDEDHEFIWTFHHIFLDGWSTSIAIKDLLNHYQSLSSENSGGNLKEHQHPLSERKTSYGEFLTWKKNISSADQRKFWRQQFLDFPGHRRLFPAPAQFGQNDQTRNSVTLSLERQLTQRLTQLIQEHELTVSSVVSAMWALTLADLYQQTDLAFHVTVSGRSVPIDQMQERVGLFSNIVPLRVSIDDSKRLINWIQSLRDLQFEVQPQEHTPADEIEKSCKLNRDCALSESLLVIENFPTFDQQNGLRLEGFQSGITTGFPLTIGILPGSSWSIECIYDTNEADQTFAQSIAQRMIRSLELWIEQPNARIDCFRQDLPTIEGAGRGEPSVADVRVDNNENQHEDCECISSPRSEIELRLTMIWEKLLGKREVGVTDNFFELGGHSLTAVRLIAQVENAFGKRFSPAILIERPTIRLMAQLIASDQPPLLSKTLIRFNECDAGSPLVCIHVGEVQAMYFRFLASYFPNRPVIAFQSRGLSGEKPHSSYEEIAADNLHRLQKLFPDRAPHFVGYCFGSQVALEMVNQLEKQNRPIGSLTIVDTGIEKIRNKTNRYDFAYYSKNETSHFRAGVRYAYSLLRRPFRTPKFYLYCGLLRMSGSENRLKFYRIWVKRATKEAFYAFVAPIVETPIHFIRSTEAALNPNRERQRLNWKMLNSNEDFSMNTIVGAHRKILMEPTVREVAEIISEVIESTEE